MSCRQTSRNLVSRTGFQTKLQKKIIAAEIYLSFTKASRLDRECGIEGIDGDFESEDVGEIQIKRIGQFLRDFQKRIGDCIGFTRASRFNKEVENEGVDNIRIN